MIKHVWNHRDPKIHAAGRVVKKNEDIAGCAYTGKYSGRGF